MDWCDQCGGRINYVGEGPLCFDCIALNDEYDNGFSSGVEHGKKLFKESLFDLKAFYSHNEVFNWTRLYTSVEFAKESAEKHFRGKIKWRKRGAGFTSGDLNYISYDVRKVKIEK